MLLSVYYFIFVNEITNMLRFVTTFCYGFLLVTVRFVTDVTGFAQESSRILKKCVVTGVICTFVRALIEKSRNIRNKPYCD